MSSGSSSSESAASQTAGSAAVEESVQAWVRAHAAALSQARDGLRAVTGRRRRRGRVAVVTDSSCALPVGRMGPLDDGLVCVQIPVMIGEQIYPESAASQELTRDLQLAVAQGTAVRTSRPSPGRLAEVYRELETQGWGGIVSVHLSAELSGTVDAARLAAQEVDLPVSVVDSRQTGAALGHAVFDAVLAAQFGGDRELVAETARSTALGSESLFVVPSLEQLRRGGRVNTLASMLGTLLWVKPILEIREGQVALLERPRTLGRAVERMSELVRERTGPLRSPRVAVHCFGETGPALELAEELSQLAAFPVPVVELPPALAAHLGLGALAVCVSPTPE